MVMCRSQFLICDRSQLIPDWKVKFSTTAWCGDPLIGSARFISGFCVRVVGIWGSSLALLIAVEFGVWCGRARYVL